MPAMSRRLAVTSEQGKPSGIDGTGIFVAALEQVTASGVKDNCDRDVTIRRFGITFAI